MACNYLEKYRFGVEVDMLVAGAQPTDPLIPDTGDPRSISVGYWKSVTGIEKSIDVNEFKTNGMPRVKKYPGFTRPGLVSMERAVYDLESNNYADPLSIGSYYLRDWYYDVVNPETGKGSNLFKRDMRIFVLDREGLIRRIVKLNGAWPTKYTYPDFDAQDSEPGYETADFRCASIEYISEGGGIGDPFVHEAGDHV